MVSSGETTVIAGAAAWVGRRSTYNIDPNGHLHRAAFCQTGSLDHPSPILSSSILKLPTPSSHLSPQLLFPFPVLSPEYNGHFSFLSLHPGWDSLGAKLWHTNVTLPSRVSQPHPGHSGSLVAKHQRGRNTLPGLPSASQGQTS